MTDVDRDPGAEINVTPAKSPIHTPDQLSPHTKEQASQLFRKEALEARSSGRMSTVIRVRAPYLTSAAYLAVATIIILISICTFGRLTQIVSAPGILIPERSSLKIFSPRSGIVVHYYVRQGQHVKAGTPLFAVSGEQYGATNIAMLERASQMIRRHLSEIKEGEVLAKQLSFERQKLLEQEIASSTDQSAITDRSMAVASAAVDLDKSILARKVNLRASDIVSVTELEKAQEVLTVDEGRMFDLMVRRQIQQSQLVSYKSELAELPIRLSESISNAEQQISMSEVELAKNELVREINVVAPADGVVATSIAYEGQNVTTDHPLLVLEPEGSELIAQILVPSSGIGFIKVGSPISIKYDAYPYQTFGYSIGRVTDINKVALLPSEVDSLKVPIDARTPVFAVLAAIDRQDITTYGHNTALLSGSTFSANLSGETRYLWQWIFNPLLSVKGDAFSNPGMSR